MVFPSPEPELAVDYLTGRRDPGGLFAHAQRLRDDAHGRVVTYSRKVFIPLTTLCADTCTYCTFAKPPGAGGEYLEPDDVLAIAKAGERHGCTEALFTLGDRPEARWPQAAEFLRRHGHDTTLDYVAAMTTRVNDETTLFPHANPGLMTAADQRRLRVSNPSLGLMLENVSDRLMEPGMPHHGCPDKEPQARLATIAAAAEAKVPFTTGILVGIGEEPHELVDSLFALDAEARRGGAIQEVIVQNFRAKADTRMRRSAEPTVQYFARVVAVARWILGAAMNVQAPPNLTDDFGVLLDAGINDWGGVSPLTIDWVNPEAPWPHLERLRHETETRGHRLRPRLPVYPGYLDAEWLDTAMLTKAASAVDAAGYAHVPAIGARS